MRSTVLEPEMSHAAASPADDLAGDPRWQLVERISQSEEFQKSSRLPALLRYLARCTILGDRNGLSEQSIGRSVFHKRQDYTPTEDSSVRVYIRQLRIRLREFYQVHGREETMVVDLPKGGYALSFTPASVVSAPASEPMPAPETPPHAVQRLSPLHWLIVGLCLTTSLCALGWYRAAKTNTHASVAWPVNQLVNEHVQATVVLADVSYSLRLLSDEPVALDSYIDRSYIKKLIPEHADRGEARLLHYLGVSQLTSIADAHAAATLTTLAYPFAQNLTIRSARDLSPADLAQGNLIFIGARSSNPWVQLYDDSLNFQNVEDMSSGSRAIRNRSPREGEQQQYSVPDSTGTSGEDYATVALLPNRNGRGSVLLIQGLRMEGTEAAINLLGSANLRAGLQAKLSAANHGVLPQYFEALLHAKSVAGAPVSVEFLSVRAH